MTQEMVHFSSLLLLQNQQLQMWLTVKHASQCFSQITRIYVTLDRHSNTHSSCLNTSTNPVEKGTLWRAKGGSDVSVPGPISQPESILLVMSP